MKVSEYFNLTGCQHDDLIKQIQYRIQKNSNVIGGFNSGFGLDITLLNCNPPATWALKMDPKPEFVKPVRAHALTSL